MRKFCKALKIKNLSLLMPQHIQISFRPQLLCPSLPAMEISVAQSELAPKPLALHELLTLPPSSERSVGFGFRRFFISDCRAGCVCPENTEPMHMHYICKKSDEFRWTSDNSSEHNYIHLRRKPAFCSRSSLPNWPFFATNLSWQALTITKVKSCFLSSLSP